MKKIYIYILVLSIGSVWFSCKKSDDTTGITKPLITFVVDKDTARLGSAIIPLGPLKDYEQGSDVVYTLTVNSGVPLTRFFVKSSSDVFSPQSKILRTDPENAIDANGNFTQSIKSVKVYYDYRIDPLVPPGSKVTVSFSFQNQSNYVGTVSHDFTTLKTGSTSGKKLQVLDFSWFNRVNMAIGTQDNFNIISGTKGQNALRPPDYQPPFMSFELNSVLGWMPDDVIANADKIDVIGFRPRYTSNNPSVALNQYYLVSPGYLPLLTHTYVGCQYLNQVLVGTSGTAQIVAAGLTLPVTFTTNLTTTATNFVNANRTAFAAKGLTLSSNGAVLIWTVAGTPAVGTAYDLVKTINVTGDLAGNPSSQQSNSQLTDTKNLQFRDCLLKMDAKLKAQGSALRTVWFKRLDNISGPSQVTVANFNTITHDNEFPVLLQGIENNGKNYTDALGFSQIWGFVMSDGRKGLLRTTDSSFPDPVSGATVTTTAPNAGNYLLIGVIKVQQKN